MQVGFPDIGATVVSRTDNMFSAVSSGDQSGGGVRVCYKSLLAMGCGVRRFAGLVVDGRGLAIHVAIRGS
ncbi:hypothetical protein [Chitinivorax sp. B]|uniref:hypothetical protein n=1 Tax=Chitinivorax sp. B TaxID=2502235 RepID=UPI0010F5738B|nr:hypothetical protein [Chitinivorax sp. B]